jgi:predicted nicotinamide N-methyase
VRHDARRRPEQDERDEPDAADAEAADRLRAFVLANTELRRPDDVPEVRLHLARDLTSLWARTEDELGRPGLEPPFWATAWAGGRALARYLLDSPDVVAGRSVLDLGSGSGLCAIAAALAGGAAGGAVTAADVDALSMAAIALNAAANGVRLRRVHRDLLAAEPPDVELIVAGDVWYDRAMSERLLAWLRTARARGSRVLLGDPGRAYLPERGLEPLARYPVTADLDLESAAVTHARVFALSA